MKTLFRNGLIFDGLGPDLLADSQVGVTDGRIVHLAREPWDERPDREIDLRGKVLMPGLIDAHYHAYAIENDSRLIEELPATYRALRARNFLQATLRRGFTSIRDAAGADYGLWRAIEEKTFPSPRLFFGDKALSQTGGHGDIRPVHLGGSACRCGACGGTLSRVVDSADAVRTAAREILRQGAHHIKIMASGGLASPTDPVWMSQYTAEEIEAAVEEANRWRCYVLAHAYGADTIARAVKCGVRSIEHGNFIDQETARLIAEKGAFVVPTLVAYDGLDDNADELGERASELGGIRQFLLSGIEAVEHCQAAGVKLGFGSDAFGNLHHYQSHEFRLRSEAQTPFEVLRSATSVNADLLQMAGVIGVVQPGAEADLIVVDGNPLEELSLLWRDESAITLVMKQGDILHERTP